MSVEKFAFNDSIVYREIGPQTILVPTGKTIDKVRSIFTLNETASFVLKLIQNQKNFSEIKKEICDSYQIVDENMLDDTLIETIHELRKHNIIM